MPFIVDLLTYLLTYLLWPSLTLHVAGRHSFVAAIVVAVIVCGRHCIQAHADRW